MTNRLDEIKQRNVKGSNYLVIAGVIVAILALMFFRCYTA